MHSKQHFTDKIALLKSELGEFYIHLLIQSVAASTIAIFVPIQLLNNGFSLSEVFIFLLIQWSIHSLFSPLAGIIINKIGIKEVIFVRTFFMCTAFIALSTIKYFTHTHLIAAIAAILLGSASILYGLSIYSIFAKFMPEETRGKETNRFLNLTRISTAVGPLIGGIISMQWGFEILAVSVSLIMIISAIPLILISKNINHPGFCLKSFFGHLKEEKKNLISLNIYGIKMFIFYILLPIIIYLSGKSTLSLGLFISIITIFNFIITKIINSIVNKKDSLNLVRFGAYITAAFLLIFGFFLKENHIIYLALFSGLVAKLIDIPFESYIFSRAKKLDLPVSFFSYKEFSLLPGRIFIISILIFLPENPEYSFYFGAAASLLMKIF